MMEGRAWHDLFLSAVYSMMIKLESMRFLITLSKIKDALSWTDLLESQRRANFVRQIDKTSFVLWNWSVIHLRFKTYLWMWFWLTYLSFVSVVLVISTLLFWQKLKHTIISGCLRHCVQSLGLYIRCYALCWFRIPAWGRSKLVGAGVD